MQPSSFGKIEIRFSQDFETYEHTLTKNIIPPPQIDNKKNRKKRRKKLEIKIFLPLVPLTKVKNKKRDKNLKHNRIEK